MSKIPVRVTSYKDYHLTILSVQDKFHTYSSDEKIKNLLCQYVELLEPYYQDVCERVFLARSAICSCKSSYRVDFENDNKNLKLIEELVKDVIATCIKKNDDININLLRFMIDHAVNLIIDYLKRYNCAGYPTFIDFWDYAWGEIRNNIDIAFSASNTDKGVTYKINLPYKSNGKMIWSRWVKVSVNKYMDPSEIKCINTGKDQVVTSMSQHLEVSRLRVINNKIELFFEVKKETPEQYKSQVIMSIDKGLNHFLAYHVESYDGVNIKITHCCNKELKKQYYKAIDSEDRQRIHTAKYNILKYAVEDFVKKIEDYQPRFIVLENMIGSFADSDDKYVRSFPWIDYQKIIRRKAAEAGVHVIMVYDNGTSQDYAMANDQIIRNKYNRSIGYCYKTGKEVNCDENAALNIWGRGVVKILEYYVLTSDQFIEVKSFVKSKGRTVATVNYALAKEVIDYCRTHFGINSF